MKTQFSARSMVAFLLLVFSLPGCQAWGWLIRSNNDSLPAPVFAHDATLDEITDHLNSERSRLIGWRSNDVKVSAAGKGLPTPSLKAKLSVQSDRNLRLEATSLRGKEVDFGSHSGPFLFWGRTQQPDINPTRCHERIAQHQVLQPPFPPSLLNEALGILTLATPRAQLLREEASSDRVQLISNQVTDGRVVQRVMVVDLVQGQVVEHALFDQQSQLICSARMSDFRRPSGDESGTTRLPHRIELNWPRAEMKLTMKMGEIEANPDFNSYTWQVLQDPNCRVVDLDREIPRR
ncbi:MAG: hypothetical protein H8E37_12540 [Planctomycetes bacterium]|nr:hypothetical protein [Planctomycetota bacterium]